MGARTAVCSGASAVQESVEALHFPVKAWTVVFVRGSVCSEHRSSPTPPPPGPWQAAVHLLQSSLHTASGRQAGKWTLASKYQRPIL